jgi:SAM-dependent methyltransferase
MSMESFKPVVVAPPSKSHLLFSLRCLIDLQLRSIVKYLRPALKQFRGNVLDVGAGESPWRDWLPTGCYYSGIDIGNSTEYGMSGDRSDLIYYDGGQMPIESASFDGAICVEVLEHAKDPELLMSEMARVLRVNSLLVITVPWSARRHHVPNDFHRFTRERLKNLLNSHGFVNVVIKERGNDIGAIASKFVVILARLILPKNKFGLVWTLPMFLFVAPLTVCMILAFYISEVFGLGSKDDPLGYFVLAHRGESKS